MFKCMFFFLLRFILNKIPHFDIYKFNINREQCICFFFLITINNHKYSIVTFLEVMGEGRWFYLFKL